MDRVDHHHLQLISQIAEALSSGELTTLFYLCESPDSDPSLARVKDLLKSKTGYHESPHLFLSEILFRLGRCDLMRKVCKVSRDVVESMLRHSQVLSGFRVLMVGISEDMIDEDVDRLKFILSSKLPPEKTENAKNFLHLMTELEKMDLVSPNRVDFVEDCLLNIGRIDLARKVSLYKKSDRRYESHPDEQQMSQISRVQCLPLGRGNMTPASTKQNSELFSDCYKLNMIPRGVCVIIDCVGKDGGMLEETFKALQFKVRLYKWQNSVDIRLTLSEIVSERENTSAGSLVCCIISRCTADSLLGTDSNGYGLHFDLIRRMFTAESCPSLAGRPKIFFIQKYNVVTNVRLDFRDEDLETDAQSWPTSKSIPIDADLFWSQCWTDVCLLDEREHRSVYLKALTIALEKKQKRDLVDIHTEVKKAIFEYNQREPERSYHINVKHTLRKKLYLQ